MNLQKVFVIGCISVLLICMCGCGSDEIEKKLSGLEEDNAALIAENAGLLKRAETAETTADSLTKKADSLEKDLAQAAAASKEQKTQISELTARVAELEAENSNLLARISFMTDETAALSDAGKYQVHDIDCTLDFKFSGYGVKVYGEPSEATLVYEMQAKDVAYASKIVIVSETKESFVKVVLQNGISGFIPLGGNPYGAGDYVPVGTLTVDGEEVTVLQLKNHFGLRGEVSLRELPSDTSAELCKTSGNYLESFEITADYAWVKICAGDVTGWVPAESLCVERGGPILYTPEEYVDWCLIAANEI